MSTTDVSEILARLDRLQADMARAIELQGTIVRNVSGEVMLIRARQDDLEKRVARLQDYAVDAPRMWRMAMLCASLAGFAAFAGVIVGQFLHH